ncbi:sugar-binding transcriptional regulator [Bauldia litoralis]|uniref:sugar-binding transcriptional regulator n=1 Tax=Bauldia litoralis TaxID=665467 RepID=UPI003264B0DE
MSIAGIDSESLRLMARVLTLHYIEGKLQSEVATELGLSSAKVNRLIKRGRELGMVHITINSPFQPLFELERKLSMRWDLRYCSVVAAVTGNAETTLNQVGKQAGEMLVDSIRDGDTIAISGGKALGAVIDNLSVDRAYDVNVAPMTGGVQGQHYTDVNHIATRLADKLGGRATLIHAPLHADTPAERDLLMSVRAVRDVMDISRKAAVAVVGIGSVVGPNATYYVAQPLPESERIKLVERGVRGEFLGHLINGDGSLAKTELNSRLVALPPQEAMSIPIRIGVASGEEKVGPIMAALNGGYINALVVDDHTAETVLESEVRVA